MLTISLLLVLLALLAVFLNLLGKCPIVVPVALVVLVLLLDRWPWR